MRRLLRRTLALLMLVLATALGGLVTPVVALAAPAVPVAVDPGLAAPVAVVEDFHAALRAALGADGFAARQVILAPAIASAFDVTTIARISVGGQWRDMDSVEQQELVDTLTALIVATYAARFDGDNGQQFETIDARELKPGRTTVRTMLRLRERDDVALDYLLSEDDGGRPTIYNVSADGVSDLSLRRAEYTAIIKRDGFPALLVALRKNTADFAADAGS